MAKNRPNLSNVSAGISTGGGQGVVAAEISDAFDTMGAVAEGLSGTFKKNEEIQQLVTQQVLDEGGDPSLIKIDNYGGESGVVKYRYNGESRTYTVKPQGRVAISTAPGAPPAAQKQTPGEALYGPRVNQPVTPPSISTPILDEPALSQPKMAGEAIPEVAPTTKVSPGESLYGPRVNEPVIPKSNLKDVGTPVPQSTSVASRTNVADSVASSPNAPVAAATVRSPASVAATVSKPPPAVGAQIVNTGATVADDIVQTGASTGAPVKGIDRLRGVADNASARVAKGGNLKMLGLGALVGIGALNLSRRTNSSDPEQSLRMQRGQY